MILVPKWILVISILGLLMLFCILIAAILIVNDAPNPGLYLEHCQKRSCASGTNLKCIDGICQCKENQYYTNKCNDKKDFSGLCQTTEQCLYNLTCIGGKCQCSATNKYWDKVKNKCYSKKTYQDTCTQGQCNDDVLLSCSNKTNNCECSQDKYWDGEVCVKHRTYGERCLNQNDCIPSRNIYCIAGICNSFILFINY